MKRPQHELGPDGTHRIVLVARDGAVVKVGEWASYGRIAVLDNYRACTRYFCGDLPVECVFTYRIVSS